MNQIVAGAVDSLIDCAQVRTTHMTGCATDVGLILGRAMGRLLRKEGCGFTQPEKNRLGLYGRLSLGFVGGAAVGTALVQEADGGDAARGKQDSRRHEERSRVRDLGFLDQRRTDGRTAYETQREASVEAQPILLGLRKAASLLSQQSSERAAENEANVRRAASHMSSSDHTRRNGRRKAVLRAEGAGRACVEISK